MGAQKKSGGHQKQPPVQKKPARAKNMLAKKAKKQAEKQQAEKEAKKKSREISKEASWFRKATEKFIDETSTFRIELCREAYNFRQALMQMQLAFAKECSTELGPAIGVPQCSEFPQPPTFALTPCDDKEMPCDDSETGDHKAKKQPRDQMPLRWVIWPMDPMDCVHAGADEFHHCLKGALFLLQILARDRHVKAEVKLSSLPEVSFTRTVIG